VLAGAPVSALELHCRHRGAVLFCFIPVKGAGFYRWQVNFHRFAGDD